MSSKESKLLQRAAAAHGDVFATQLGEWLHDCRYWLSVRQDRPQLLSTANARRTYARELREQSQEVREKLIELRKLSDNLLRLAWKKNPGFDFWVGARQSQDALDRSLEDVLAVIDRRLALEPATGRPADEVKQHLAATLVAMFTDAGIPQRLWLNAAGGSVSLMVECLSVGLRLSPDAARKMATRQRRSRRPT